MFDAPDRTDHTQGFHVGAVTRLGAGGKTAWVRFTGEGRGAWEYGPCRVPDHITLAVTVVGGDVTTVTARPLKVGETVSVHIARFGAFILGRYA